MKKACQGFLRFIHSLHPIRLVTLGYLSHMLAASPQNEGYGTCCVYS